MKKFRSILLTALIIASTITAYGATYTLTSASYPVNVNGQKLAAEPLNMNGTTYLPLRSISEAVGVPIAWDDAKKSVEINTVDVEKLKESCVMLYFTQDEKAAFQGSGVYIDYDKILTANHVVGKITITSDKTKLTPYSSDAGKDIAILSSPVNVKPVKIGDSDEVKAGDKVIVIASPWQEENKAIYGDVKRTDNGLIVLSTVTGPGASGGAVFDMNGCLVGIIYGGQDSTTETYVRSINEIRKAL